VHEHQINRYITAVVFYLFRNTDDSVTLSTDLHFVRLPTAFVTYEGQSKSFEPDYFPLHFWTGKYY